MPAKTYIHDGCTLLDDLVKLTAFGGNGLVADKALFRVADNVHFQPCAHPDLVQDNLAVCASLMALVAYAR